MLDDLPDPIRDLRADAAPAGSAVAPSAAPAGSRRRRLWELSEPARDLVVGLGLPAEPLRQTLEKALAQVHRRPCRLVGRPGAVLASVRHDLATRNPVSERLHRRLEARHALAVTDLSRLRDAGAVEDRWQAALASESIGPMAWAVMTHPLGAGLETRVLQDAQAWCWERLHDRSQTHDRLVATQAAWAEARREIDDLRLRLTVAVAARDVERQARRRLQDEVEGLRMRAEAPPPDAALPVAAPVPSLAGPAPVAGRPAPDRRPDVRRPPVADAGANRVVADAEPGAARGLAGGGDATAVARPAGIAVGGKDVLCVGGIRRAVARYRAVVERAGGRFAHHDGGVEDGVARLEHALARADLVVCQAGCLNHEAYHRIKRHCRATGTPCIYLDRPSLSAFGQALATVPPTPTVPTAP